jgi:D-sedoheptulose 7-phosphate isomerase
MPAAPLSDLVRQRLDRSAAAFASLREQSATVVAACELVAATLRSGGTVFTAGNGGSAAEALHLAEELTGRYRSNRPPLAAIPLVADPTALTCIGNDFGFDEVFARPARALLKKGDLLVLFSTSGKSPNLLKVAEVAREKGATTLGLLGGDGGPLKPLCTLSLVVGGGDGAAVQEAHQAILHCICEGLEP